MFILARGLKRLYPVLLRLVGHHMKAATKPASKPNSKKQSQPSLEEAAALVDEDRDSYQITMTKWVKGVFEAITNPFFWLILQIANKTREPLQHLFAFLQKESQNRPIFQLVCGNPGKVGQIQKEFRNLVLTFDSWFSDAVDYVRSSGIFKQFEQEQLPEKLIRHFKTFAFKLLLFQFGAFELRIAGPLSRHIRRFIDLYLFAC